MLFSVPEPDIISFKVERILEEGDRLMTQQINERED